MIRQTKMKTKAFALVEALIIAAIILLLAMLAWSYWHKEHVVMPAAYRVWVKQTGNTNDLTYEEWRTLLRATEQDSTTVIFVPH